jgi:hypothetical protein
MATMITAPNIADIKRYRPPMIDSFIMFLIISFIVILIYELKGGDPTPP